MANERVLRVTVVGDDRDLQRMFDRQSRTVSGFERRFGTLGQSVRAGLAGAGIAVGIQETFDIIGRSVGNASDLNEEVAKSEQIFGDSSDAIQAWANTTARELGIARNQALQATGTFGNLFRVVEIAPEQAADMSRALVQLAADLASFNNANPEDVLLALRSGLIGEAEPLRRYGVLLSEARVQQVALATTGKTNVQTLTDQEKALARYQIILEDTAPAQGDVARTSESLANQSRQLRAQMNDLSADLGSILIPVLTDAATAANLLFDALDAMRGVDFSPGFDFPDPPSWLSGLALAPLSPAGAVAVTIKKALEDDAKAAEEAVAAGPGRGIGEHIAQRREEEAKELVEAQAKAERSRERGQKAFRELQLGLGLKLDRAGLTEGLGDDLAALQELEAAILRQINREGRTFDLVNALTQTRLDIASVQATQAADAQQRAEEGYRAIIDTLNLRIEQALRTASFEDDLQALENLERAIRTRITAEGRTTDLLEQLDDVRARQAETLRQQRERQRELQQGRQFESLGLTAEGQERTPGRGALLRRANTLEEQIKGTVLDTDKTRTQLDAIQRLLTDKTQEVGRTVREAILRMLNEISDAFDQGKGAGGAQTKFAKRGIDQLIEGLGLSPEQVKELRQRFAGAPGAVGPAITTGPAGGSAVVGALGGAIELTVHTHVDLDGKEIASSTTKHQEKKRGQRTPSRRGPRAGR